LIDISIKHGYGQVIESILSPDVGHAVSGPLLRKALLEGDIKVMKIILGAAKGSEGTLEVDPTKLDAVMNALPKERGGDLTKEKRCQLVATLFGEVLNESSPQENQDSHAALLELQTASANPTPFVAFAQHVKMQMPEEYQSNWLNKTGEDKLLIDTFDQLRRKNYQDLLQFKDEIEKRIWCSFLTEHDNIIKYFYTYRNSIDISLNVNDNEWDGSEDFRWACGDGQ